MSVNDRGTIKWTSMMMPEHIEILKEIHEQQEWKKKPMISEFQKEEINLALQLALKDDLTIELEFFRDHDYHKIKGKVLGVDVLNQFVTINEQIVPLDSITGAWID
ncbi:YolD-like family protein [Oceanobacillus jordanicus]|uniref:YolD-like family protein n=1 Tax=Oceanobacillus jordanicus TaxID=2867266 RepID=A0AAW5B5J4_9BACI|nr:YolD-like family protein [Oceanobacillus jordanicus]MCG3418950.1 YolD-like family protein [Oceanobacillus jordanicus]